MYLESWVTGSRGFTHTHFKPLGLSPFGSQQQKVNTALNDVIMVNLYVSRVMKHHKIKKQKQAYPLGCVSWKVTERPLSCLGLQRRRRR